MFSPSIPVSSLMENFTRIGRPKVLYVWARKRSPLRPLIVNVMSVKQKHGATYVIGYDDRGRKISIAGKSLALII